MKTKSTIAQKINGLLSLVIICSFILIPFNLISQNPSSNIPWKVLGNNTTTGNFIGTTNATDLVLKSNNIEGLRLTSPDANVSFTSNLTFNKFKIPNPPVNQVQRLLSVDASGTLRISSVTLPVDDMFVCSTAPVMPWVFSDGTPTDDDILLCPNYKSATVEGDVFVGSDFDVKGKSTLRFVGIGNVLQSEIGGISPFLYVKREGLPNAITARFEAKDGFSDRSIFFSNTLTNSGHNPISVAGDVGMFWTNKFNGPNSAGMVIGPKTPTGVVPNIPIGMRIDEDGRFAFNTVVDPQAQYTMRSNSTIGLLIDNTSTPVTIYGLRTVTQADDIAISVAGPVTNINDRGFFSVTGKGAVDVRNSVTIRTDPSQITKSLTVKDLNNTDDNTNDVFRVTSDGNVFATRVKVLLTPFPDYVFNKDYKLMTLNNLESYVKTNKHLPNMPTAEQVKKDGADLGEINRVLVEKVEELTLYMIEMNKRMELLEIENKKMKH